MGKSIGFSQTLFDDHTTMLLYRLYPDRAPRYLTNLTVRQFDLMRMCERYGTGRYLVCIKHRGRMIQKRCQITGEHVITTRRWVVRWG
jgi:hypothetical protein